MRLIKISAPEGKGREIIETALAAGIEDASINHGELYRANGRVEKRDIVDLETSTPRAKKFTQALLAADFYDVETFSITTRQPRSIISSKSTYDLTLPLVEPDIDIFQELWQFSHVTWGFAGRILLAGSLLSFGLIRQQMLLIVAGLLFLPLLPVLMSIGFGAWTRQWKLSLQGILATTTAVFLLILSGMAVALLSDPPLKYNEFNSLQVSALISLAVGDAAALANIDDVGRRELIGLAATSQIAILPAWLAVCVIFGVPATTGREEIILRVIGFFVNILIVIGASLATYIFVGAGSRVTSKIKP